MATEFKILVLPTDILSVCDNYFCFPEVSNIMAEDAINHFRKYSNIKVIEISQVREAMNNDQVLKTKTKIVLDQFAQNDKIDFYVLKEIADAFDVKSVLLITSYATNDKVAIRRNLWNVLELSTAFHFTYPFELKTSVVLTDSVNNLVMWSGKYSKQVSDSDGLYSASNQSQAMSQLEKVKLYSKDNISQNITQNVYMRFFPRDVRVFDIPKNQDSTSSLPKFVPNALEHLSDPTIRKNFENSGILDFKDSADDLIFEF